jgi:hypothetical protein
VATGDHPPGSEPFDVTLPEGFELGCTDRRSRRQPSRRVARWSAMARSLSCAASDGERRPRGVARRDEGGRAAGERHRPCWARNVAGERGDAGPRRRRLHLVVTAPQQPARWALPQDTRRAAHHAPCRSASWVSRRSRSSSFASVAERGPGHPHSARSGTKAWRGVSAVSHPRVESGAPGLNPRAEWMLQRGAACSAVLRGPGLGQLCGADPVGDEHALHVLLPVRWSASELTLPRCGSRRPGLE